MFFASSGCFWPSLCLQIHIEVRAIEFTPSAQENHRLFIQGANELDGEMDWNKQSMGAKNGFK